METQAPPTETQLYYRAALNGSEYELLAELGTVGYAYAPLATERSQQLINLYHAGYARSWQGVFYLTTAGRLRLDQYLVAGDDDAPRALGNTACPTCGKAYDEHPKYTKQLSNEGQPYLTLLCDGSKVKL